MSKPLTEIAAIDFDSNLCGFMIVLRLELSIYNGCNDFRGIAFQFGGIGRRKHDDCPDFFR